MAKSISMAGTTLLFMTTPFSLMPSNVMFGKASSLASEIRSTSLGCLYHSGKHEDEKQRSHKDAAAGLISCFVLLHDNYLLYDNFQFTLVFAKLKTITCKNTWSGNRFSPNPESFSGILSPGEC